MSSEGTVLFIPLAGWTSVKVWLIICSCETPVSLGRKECLFIIIISSSSGSFQFALNLHLLLFLFFLILFLFFIFIYFFY